MAVSASPPEREDHLKRTAEIAQSHDTRQLEHTGMSLHTELPFK